MAGLDAFAGGDQRYLREVQYRSPEKLWARANLHVKYRTARERWFPWLAGQVDWPQSGDVLEVGCGPGWMWAEAAGRYPEGMRLTLTDLSPGMVEEASVRVAALENFEAVRTEVVDAQMLPFDDQSFDVVVANHMLYHVPDPSLAISEIARVLRPGGCLLAAANGPRNMRELWEIRAEVFGVPYEAGTTKKFGSASGALLLQASFERVDWRRYRDQLLCTEPDDVIAFLTSMPPGEDASPETRTILARAVQLRFDNGGGVFPITKESGALVARLPKH